MGPSPSKLTRGRKRSWFKEADENDRVRAGKEGKILNFILLGSGESGKSTFLRQMKNLYGEGFTREYKVLMKPYIIYNIVDGCVNVLKALEYENKDLSPKLKEALDILVKYPSPGNYSKNKIAETGAHNLNKITAQAVLTCLEDKDFIIEGESHSNYLIQDSWFMLAEKLRNYPEWGGEDWIPSSEDILNCRIRTAALTDTFFKVDKLIYRMIDVSGQIGQRRKYMHLFTDMNVVLFVQSLSEYNLNMFEQKSTARFEDSFQFWKGIIKSSEFKNCIFILFFNKKDIFQQKYYVDQIPLPTINKEFRMPPKVEEEEDENCKLALKWYEDMYVSQLTPSQKSRTCVKFTTATDESVMQEVTNDVSTFLVSEVLKSHGLLDHNA